MAIEKQRIRHHHLILCEGTDDVNFFISYLNSAPIIAKDERFSSDVDVLCYKGIGNLKTFLATIRGIEGFSSLKTLLIIRDAEDDPISAQKQIKTALEAANFGCPDSPCSWNRDKELAVAYLLFPTLNTEIRAGALEHFCMDVLREEYMPDKVLEQVDFTMNSLENLHIRLFSNTFKPRLHAFFSFTDKFVGKKIGEAAKAGAFDWSSPKFEAMSKLIMEGFEI